jgi:predicted ATP-grasp superfamily ATP-dependent carboligase
MNLVEMFSGRTLIVAFEGWNDAGEAASGAARFLLDTVGANPEFEIEPQDYYDFQFARPQVYFDTEGKRALRWPGAVIYKPDMSELFNLRVLLGVEPNRNWQQFTSELVDQIEASEVDSVIFLGALLADTPHTRPIQVTATSANPDVYALAEVEKATYEGPVGILTLLAMELEKREIPSMSLWASVPHYVHNGPAPKASLALLIEIEKFISMQFDHGELPGEAFKWERAVDELAESDEDLAEYVVTLEKTRDELDGASGDVIAREVEQFLRDSDEER